VSIEIVEISSDEAQQQSGKSRANQNGFQRLVRGLDLSPEVENERKQTYSKVFRIER